MRAMGVAGREALATRARARLLEQLGEDARALAEVAVAAGRMGSPCEVLHPLLEAFLAAQAGPRPAAPSAPVLRAQALAREHGVRKPRAPRKKKAPGAEGAPRPKRKSGARKKAPPPSPPDDEKGDPR